jgi:hypothetical protein
MYQRQARRLGLDPATPCGPPLAGHARGQAGEGTIRIHARQDTRLLCTEGRQTCPASPGTALYRLRISAETVTRVVTLLAHGGPLHAMVVAFGCDERTVATWWARAGRPGQAVQESLVEHPRDLGQGQADARRVKTQGAIVWMALAMMVTTRRWLAGEVNEPRDRTLRRRLIERGRRGAAPRALVCCPDGWSSSIRAMRETLRDPVKTGTLTG